MQKADSNSSAGSAAGSEQKVENIFGSSNDIKPHVVGSQSHGTLLESVQPIVKKRNILMSAKLKEWVKKNTVFVKVGYCFEMP